MIIGIPKTTQAGERRVALTPDVVARLAKDGHEIVVEAGAGKAAGFIDEAYIQDLQPRTAVRGAQAEGGLEQGA